MEKLVANSCPTTEMVPMSTYYLKIKANRWNTVKSSCMATAGFGCAHFSAKLNE